MNEVGERMSGRFRSVPRTRKAGKHGLGLGKGNVRHLPAITAMPTERRSLKAARLRVEQQKQQLQCIG